MVTHPHIQSSEETGIITSHTRLLITKDNGNTRRVKKKLVCKQTFTAIPQKTPSFVPNTSVLISTNQEPRTDSIFSLLTKD